MKNACTLFFHEDGLSNNDVSFSVTGNSIRIPFPEEDVARLKELDPDNETGFLTSEPSYFGHGSLVELGEAAKLKNLDTLVHTESRHFAKTIIDNIEKAKRENGRLPFNGTSHGVSKFTPTNRGVVISIHDSNFMTNRTMNRVYMSLVDQGQITAAMVKDAVLGDKPNRLAFLFSNFGANVSVISQSQHYMMGTRPNGMAHVAVNEGIDHREQDGSTLHDLCARGFEEELGISTKALNATTTKESVREFFLTATGQFGIHSLYDLKMSPEDIAKSHATAEDGWENPNIRPVPLKKSALVEETRENMVPYTQTLIRRLARTL